ncbi:hypothetical protein AAFC00_002823 [Neodothiora populina]|uniref:Peroxisomal ATPase PEX6 n=1 Tax=Neodothiora populina TaxID=2781224 RepID=A0ABR3P8D2_9PEZI
MAADDPHPRSLKRKRGRRRQDKPFISCHLHLDSKLKGDTALLSEDLVADLLPAGHGDPGVTFYMAITVWTTASDLSATSAQWTVLPCRSLPRGHRALPHSSMRVSILSHAARVLQSHAPDRLFRPGSAVEIRVADVVPLALDTLFVSLASASTDSTGTNTNAQLDTPPRPTNGLRSGNKRRQKELDSRITVSAEQGLQMVRDALKDTQLVSVGNVITSPALTATVAACEPVSQGLLTKSTRIVIVSQGSRSDRRPKSASKNVAITAGGHDTSYETSNEAFFTAAEDGLATATDDDGDATSDTQDSLDESDADLSDDLEDMISLSSPAIASQTPGIASALTSSTPRPFGMLANGISTPGSGHSSMTTATSRGGQGGKSKVFKTQGLLQRVPDALLHPKPSSQEDEESRVFVETSALAKLGCFSGDWVRVEPSLDPSVSNPLSLGLARLDHEGSQRNDVWRPVRLYALPDSLAPKPPLRYHLSGKSGRRDSISSSQVLAPAPAVLYLSPVLLANMGEASHICVSAIRAPENMSSSRPLHLKSRLSASSMPPVAKAVSLVQISTPLSTERPIQPSLFIGLRDYFEQKQRVVKSGDLLTIPIDETLGRAIYEGGGADEENGNNDLLSRPLSMGSDFPKTNQVQRTAVAWFQIRDVTPASANEGQGAEEAGAWGGVVIVDPSRTRIGQSGLEQKRLPATMSNVWPFYQGLNKAPASTEKTRSVARAPPKPFVSQLRRRIRELMLAAMSPRATYLSLPPLAILLTSTQRHIGKAYTVSQACMDLGMHFFAIDAYETLSEGGAGGGGDNKTEVLLKMRAERALTCGPQNTALLIRHIEALSSDRMAAALKDILADCRVLVATSTEVDKIPDNIRALFTQELEMSAPDEGEREGILRSVIADTGVPLSPSVDLSSIAVKTAALVAGDLVDVTERALYNQTSRLEALAALASSTRGQTITLRDIQLSGGDATTSLMPADFDQAVDDARKNFADAIGAPKIPNVQWSDVGGLANVKDAVIETIQLPLSRPELFAKGLKKRSGILFYGPPGTGKTLLAKAIATEFSLNFFSVKGPELLNMYIGESEANVRRVFQRARDARPCCVFFDELDSVAPKRGNQGDSGGVMDRIVSQLLAELDGMSDGEDGGGGVFVIGATNRPDLLDQALLRPGRFDKMLYLGVSDTHEKQQNILQALTRKFALAPDLDLKRIAERLPFTYTGADFYALCSDAMLKAITRSARLVDARVAAINAERAAAAAGSPPKPAISIAYFFDHYATDEYTRVVVAEEDFIGAQKELVPSVSAEELGHYERVRKEFEGGKEKETAATSSSSSSSSSSSAAAAAERANAIAMRDEMAHLLRAQMTQRQAEEQSHRNTSNGKAAAAAAAAARVRATKPDDQDDDDDYIIKTDHLSLNGSGKGKGKAPPVQDDEGKAKGKGKGKGVAVDADAEYDEAGFGDAAAADDDLYA